MKRSKRLIVLVIVLLVAVGGHLLIDRLAPSDNPEYPGTTEPPANVLAFSPNTITRLRLTRAG